MQREALDAATRGTSLFQEETEHFIGKMLTEAVMI